MRVFTPGQAPISALRRHMAETGVSRVVVVQPSVYATDNRCAQIALAELGSSARGVCVVDDDVSEQTLNALYEAGFRGIRLNLQTGGKADPAELALRLQILGERIGTRGWHIQIFCEPKLLCALRPFAGKNILVLDHFAGISGLDHEAIDDLCTLLDTGATYLKLSAIERVLQDRHALGPLVRHLARHYPARLLWGSDWPHPGTLGGRRVKDGIEPFRAVDDGEALACLINWVDDDATAHAILVANPQALYGFVPLSG